MGATLKDLRRSPEAVRGEKPANAKPLKGFRGAGVLEIVEDHRGDTWRAVYTVEIVNAIYVLHFFQKKSKQGIATPQHHIDLIRRRLRDARELVKRGLQ
jgi:phage-related protein